MKPHTILKSFNGSQTGHDFQQFQAGSVADLSRDLAAIAVKEGWAEPYATGGIVPPSKPLLVGEVPSESTIPAENRETKVVGPEETKVVTPDEAKSFDDMTFAELKAAAKLKGVKVFGLSEDKLRAALKA